MLREREREFLYILISCLFELFNLFFDERYETNFLALFWSPNLSFWFGFASVILPSAETEGLLLFFIRFGW